MMSAPNYDPPSGLTTDTSDNESAPTTDEEVDDTPPATPPPPETAAVVTTAAPPSQQLEQSIMENDTIEDCFTFRVPEVSDSLPIFTQRPPSATAAVSVQQESLQQQKTGVDDNNDRKNDDMVKTTDDIGISASANAFQNTFVLDKEEFERVSREVSDIKNINNNNEGASMSAYIHRTQSGSQRVVLTPAQPRQEAGSSKDEVPLSTAVPKQQEEFYAEQNIETLTHALHTRESAVGPNHHTLYPLLLSLARHHSDVDDDDKADWFYSRAIFVMQDGVCNGKKYDARLVPLLEEVAVFHRRRGAVDTFASFSQRAYEIRRAHGMSTSEAPHLQPTLRPRRQDTVQTPAAPLLPKSSSAHTSRLAADAAHGVRGGDDIDFKSTLASVLRERGPRDPKQPDKMEIARLLADSVTPSAVPRWSDQRRRKADADKCLMKSKLTKEEIEQLPLLHYLMDPKYTRQTREVTGLIKRLDLDKDYEIHNAEQLKETEKELKARAVAGDGPVHTARDLRELIHRLDIINDRQHHHDQNMTVVSHSATKVVKRTLLESSDERLQHLARYNNRIGIHNAEVKGVLAALRETLKQISK